MRSGMTAALCALGLAACSSGPTVASYPGTDIPVFEGFRLQSAEGVQKTGRQFREGSLSYAGKGEVPDLFRDYAEAMRDRDWVQTTADVDRDRATGRFRKDDRVALVEMNRQADKNVLVNVQVKQAEPQTR